MQTISVPTPQLVKFTTADETDLALDVYFPDETDRTPRPVVLLMTPYQKPNLMPTELPIADLTANGYLCVVADIRGTGESSGIFEGPLSPREIQDGAELIEWLADQDFSDGQVALAGGSYCGAIQMLVAAKRPRGLVCIAPSVGPIDFYRDWTHRGGIPSHTNWAAGTFLQANQPNCSIAPALDFYYNVAQSTPLDGEVFWERSAYRVLSSIEVPALFMGGLFDYFGRGTLRAFDNLKAPKRLVFGPWGHQYPEDSSELLNWLAYWLKGEGENPTERDNVKFWMIGADDWRSSKGRRLPGSHLAVPLGAEIPTIPVTETFRGWPMSAPPSPVPVFMDTGTNSGMHLWGETVTRDLDIPEGTEIQGAPILKLDVASPECRDIDLHARLSLVHPNGDVTQLTEARLRLSHRTIDEHASRYLANGEIEYVHHKHTQEQPLSLESTNEVLLQFQPTGVALQKGFRLRLGFSACRADGILRPSEIYLAGQSALLLPTLNL
ncbi:CocE/NonD family hydrolase [Arthrobacter sp. fls2-241-R2A-172]|uniref:CocE/NonD family hydrolase n=1 Tax=Arthrobacter sp. fls2-241-R2A-172 TaxID=3040325 RepID=UPI00254F4279|nr:CocE/NonD family hydrolase [Arthrobacter sp. fls2-241-R2A-172]